VITPLVENDDRISVVSIPNSRDLKSWFTPHENYEPRLEDLVGDMIVLNSGTLADFLRLALSPDSVPTRRGAEIFVFSAEIPVEEITHWILARPELAPYVA
jgi:hypothetical protein